MKDLRKVTTLVTHSGKFHADDVFSTALLLMVNENIISPEAIEKLTSYYIDDPIQVPAEYTKEDKMIRIYRCTNVNNIYDDDDVVIYDIGRGQYDHHQPDAEVRKNGVKYASFGLLYRELWQYIFDDPEEADIFEKTCVQMIDETDNTGKPNAISAYISTFMPAWDDDKTDYTTNTGFCEAVKFAYRYMYGFIRQANSRVRAYKICEESEIVNKHILVLDEYLPCNRWAYKNSLWCIVFPSLRGGWAASVVSDNTGCNVALFPPEWRGASRVSLFRDSKISTLNFCHTSGFMVVCDTKEDAIKAAMYAHPINL